MVGTLFPGAIDHLFKDSLKAIQTVWEAIEPEMKTLHENHGMQTNSGYRIHPYIGMLEADGEVLESNFRTGDFSISFRPLWQMIQDRDQSSVPSIGSSLQDPLMTAGPLFRFGVLEPNNEWGLGGSTTRQIEGTDMKGPVQFVDSVWESNREI